MVAVDRQERGPGGGSALAEVGRAHGFPVTAIVTLDEIVTFLTQQCIDGRWWLSVELRERIARYRSEYGC